MDTYIKRTIYFCICILISQISIAQNGSNWKTTETNEFSIKIPENWIEENNIPTRTTESGLIIAKHAYQTPRTKEEGGIFVDVIKYDDKTGITINDIYNRDVYTIKKLYNGTCNNQIATLPCKQHYTLEYEYDNPYMNKTECMKTHIWLYEYGKSIYSLNILYENAMTKKCNNLEDIINQIYQSFILK